MLVEAAVIHVCIAIDFQNDRVCLQRIADSRRTAGQQSRRMLVNVVVNPGVLREHAGTGVVWDRVRQKPVRDVVVAETDVIVGLERIKAKG